MNKVVLLFCIIVSAFSVKAQVEIGLKGGGSVSTLQYKDIPTEKSSATINYFAGIRTSVNLVGNLFVQPELLYSAKGFKYIEESKDVYVHLNYITLPVLLRYEFFERVSVLGGIELGSLTKAVSEYDTYEENARNLYKNVDAGYVAGLSVKLNNVFGVEARYNSGFVPLKDFYYSDSETITIKKIKDGYNRNFQLGAYINIVNK